MGWWQSSPLVEMGTVTLLLPDPVPAAAESALGEICFAGGYDMAPQPVEVVRQRDRILLHRPEADSGFLMVPWVIENLGPVVIHTSTIRQRAEPYRLSVELARGKLNHLRNQTAEWTDIGLELSPLFRERLRAANAIFGKAATADDPKTADREAAAALAEAVALSGELVRVYTDQVFRTRHVQESQLRTALGCRLTGPPPGAEASRFYQAAFNAVRIVPLWSRIEPRQSEFAWEELDALVAWAHSAKLNVSLGPLIDLRPGLMPKWVDDWHGDWSSMAAFACDFVEMVMVRYGERIGTWLIASGFNHEDLGGLIEDDRIRLAARLLDSARQIDRDGELIVGLARPWGEYRREPEYNYSPLLFADTLLRAGIRISGFELEIFESGPSGGWPREPLEFVRLLDAFGTLGVSLDIALAGPAEPVATSESRLASLYSVAACMPHIRSVFWRDWSAGPMPLLRGPSESALLAAIRNLRTSHFV
jgi:hypothetical protein